MPTAGQLILMLTPAAVSLINVFIEIQERRREQAATL
jgi:hypothetical protein